MTIGGLSKATGCNAETIRYYERIGLLPAPERTEAGYRIYGGAHARRLYFVRRARALGFPIETIRGLLDLASDRDRSCAEIDGLVGERIAEVEAKIADLERLRAELRRLEAQCRGGRVSECRIVEALSSDPGAEMNGRVRAA
ncbi:MAG TPA: helix-turn-helix domain-containing protein [Alphaproteobacteria bacterium]|nr:helix-turn-helix domain-containing protein [Alphaproteobacteria bacterium]